MDSAAIITTTAKQSEHHPEQNIHHNPLSGSVGNAEKQQQLALVTPVADTADTAHTAEADTEDAAALARSDVLLEKLEIKKLILVEQLNKMKARRQDAGVELVVVKGMIGLLG